MPNFRIEFEGGTSFTEGGTLDFRIHWDGPVSASTVLKWEVLFEGFLPTNSDDYDGALIGTVDVPQSSGPGMSSIISITLRNDNIGEPVKEIAVRVSADDTNTNGVDTIEPSESSATLEDDGEFPSAGSYLLGGGNNENVYTFGSTSDGQAEGLVGRDTYIITRYQSADVTISEVDFSIVRLDFGVEIARYVTALGDGIIILESGATIRLPLVDTRWEFQIGDGEILTPAEFIEAIRVPNATDSTILEAPSPGNHYIVPSYLEDEDAGSVGEGHDNAAIIGGTASSEDVFTVGLDSASTLEGLVGKDIYIITRYQNANVTIGEVDVSLVKLDAGLQVARFVTALGDGIIILENGSTIRLPLVDTRWEFQIGDGEVLSLAEFIEAIRVPNATDSTILEAPSAGNVFTVPFPDSGPPVDPSNNVPTLTGTNLDAIFVKGVAETVNLSGEFADADGDTLTFSSSNLPTGFTLDSATGVLSSTSGTVVGLFEDVVVTASDGKSAGTVDYTFDISVSIAEDPTYYFAWSPTGTDRDGVLTKKGSLDRYTVSDDAFSATPDDEPDILSVDNVVRLGSTFTDDADGETISLGGGSDLYRVEAGFNADVIIDDRSATDGDAANVIQFLSDVTINGYEVVEVNIIQSDPSATLRTLYLQIDKGAAEDVILQIEVPKTQFYQVGAATETLLTYDDFLATLTEIDIPDVGPPVV